MKKRIYIIEDDRSINRGIELTLGHEKYVFESFYHLADIRDIHKADLVVLDINLPDGNGLEYLKKLRDFSRVPVLVLTANDGEYLAHSPNKGVMKLCFNVDDAHMDEVEASLTQYCEEEIPHLDFESRNKYKEDFKEMQRIFLLIGTALSFILALIGILNYINLTYTSINERWKELDTLHALGMTFGQMKKMLVAEGVIRIVLTFAVVFTIGIGLNRALVTMIAGMVPYFVCRNGLSL